VEAVVLFVAFGAEPLEDVEEARAVFGFVDREKTIVQATRAARIRAEREELEERGQTFLHGGRARRALREPFRDGLALPIQRSRNVDPAFMDFENVDVTRREHRA